MSSLEEIKSIAKLHADGILTDEEFAMQKARLLQKYSQESKGQGTAPPPSAAPARPAAAPNAAYVEEKDKTVAALLGIFLGGLGIHKFYLGYQNAGVIHLVIYLVGIFLFFIGPFVISLIGFIEGIMYLTKSDEEFRNTYVLNRKEWF